MRTVRAHQGETLDQLCYRVLGTTAGVTEQALQLNPGIAELGPVLPEGALIRLPEAQASQPRIKTIQLWT